MQGILTNAPSDKRCKPQLLLLCFSLAQCFRYDVHSITVFVTMAAEQCSRQMRTKIPFGNNNSHVV
jgi:hypothetical protein